jgi:hypothetical protein
MIRAEQLKFCKICLNRTLSKERGLICKLTNEKADFETNCSSFSKDEDAYYNELLFESRNVESSIPKDYMFGLEKYGIKNGIVAGVILLLIGFGWLLTGLKYHFIFWYPLILIVVGAFVLVGGIVNYIIRQKLNKNQQIKLEENNQTLDA